MSYTEFSSFFYFSFRMMILVFPSLLGRYIFISIYQEWHFIISNIHVAALAFYYFLVFLGKF